MKAVGDMLSRELAEHGIPTEVALTERARVVRARSDQAGAIGDWPTANYLHGLSVGLRVAREIIEAKRATS